VLFVVLAPPLTGLNKTKPAILMYWISSIYLFDSGIGFLLTLVGMDGPWAKFLAVSH
jgi:hypothetical protein